MSSHSALQMQEVSSKYLLRFLSNGVDTQSHFRNQKEITKKL